MEITSEEMESIVTIRNRIMEESLTDTEAFDQCDLKRIGDDLYVKRFLDERYGKVKDAIKMLSDCLRWRKSFGVNTMKSSDFPKEIFRVGELHEFYKDKNNITTLYLRIERHRALSGWMPMIKRYIVFMIERAEKQAARNGHGIGLVVDARRGSISNVEIELDFFAVKTILNYYPGSLQYLAVYEIPWLLMAILKLVKSWFPAQYQNKFHFLNPNNIDNFLGLDNVPDYMGGTRPMLWPEEVFTSPSTEELEAKGDLPKGSTNLVRTCYASALQDFQDCPDKQILKTINFDQDHLDKVDQVNPIVGETIVDIVTNNQQITSGANGEIMVSS
ncbi:motile sperm domain-containing protein 2-like [Panonychus citri]|uniref:motile sperm domain-containing protein 2-like n=1 Tax=Panonychus citri TaxID=50023 RepID=UPI002307481E|nr:motile sperm domain-containing protein 2-like [Panonychus citri]XP_053200654.1 motile sperm domain-containing protein 2-like [Panonychus citri]